MNSLTGIMTNVWAGLAQAAHNIQNHEAAIDGLFIVHRRQFALLFIRQLLSKSTTSKLYSATLVALVTNAAAFISVTVADIMANSWFNQWGVAMASVTLFVLAFDICNLLVNRKTMSTTAANAAQIKTTPTRI